MSFTQRGLGWSFEACWRLPPAQHGGAAACTSLGSFEVLSGLTMFQDDAIHPIWPRRVR